MTKNDIIKLAKKVGLCIDKELQPELIVFSSLVAAAEREACAGLLESRKTNANSLIDAVRDMEAAAIRARKTT